ncbi:dipeptidyl peptidase 3 [Parabacteroides sp. AGMB00274]|uniref:Dipeptidyl peptidase 3 n=1 Tax=Parabacteroides faecalis TaxID=2924040 RepID=A0ABT0C1M7_9BACT|nr:dipeptidyl peptidase 3 [Parabacteroides faecalis]MCI7287060.1 dipeptidyl peptidase 3 [Parabacteroides sp.]MCJ2380917.1 dipeptidyl peptidase 3 [Parabacteroides faecalis]MDY6253630.1 dipeptidyl peptidase 3 [Bacteroidales bacterium]
MKEEFSYIVDQFADLQILRYQVPGFENLSLRQKQLLYHLSEAALMGRDILFDQNGRYNLVIRRTLEAVYQYGTVDKSSVDYQAFEVYLKRIWFANGIHHHYGEDKFIPGFSEAFFDAAVRSVDVSLLPLKAGETVDTLLARLKPVIFDPTVMPKRTVQSGDTDWIQASANNYYGEDVTQAEVEAFYGKMKAEGDSRCPLSYGLNSRLEKENGQLVERVWKVGGLYSEAIERIVVELEKAAAFAENEKQRQIIATLIDYYRTGDLRTFDAYSILWVEDTDSQVDFVNGFIETYGDALGLKASWESTVNFRNEEATRRTQTISENAQWFEDHSPVDQRFKKERVKGVSAKVITVTMLGGDCYPSTPIGINLPNADWIRRDHGSKSVTIENIMEAYDKASQGSGFSDEFVWSDEERNRIKTYGFLTDMLHTDLHECLGHGSGQLLPDTDPDALKAYASTLEEARADLFGLYYLADPKMQELGLAPDGEAFKAEYYKYMMNGLLTQLVRIEEGKEVEEAHMRNRQLIARWVFEQGATDKVVELKKREGKTFVVINDYQQLRALFGKLLAEVQRIKSEGDYEAGRSLVENYGVKIDPVLHHEIRERYVRLHLSPYKGFVNPVMREVKDDSGHVTDITLDYTEGYAEQMLRYSRDYSYLSL